MLIKDYEFNSKKELTPEAIEELEALKNIEPVPDEDCPAFTAEQLSQFKKISEINRQNRRKQTVTLRLSPQALKTAKSMGKGYTSVLSRILESALNDKDFIKKYL